MSKNYENLLEAVTAIQSGLDDDFAGESYASYLIERERRLSLLLAAVANANENQVVIDDDDGVTLDNEQSFLNYLVSQGLSAKQIICSNGQFSTVEMLSEQITTALSNYYADEPVIQSGKTYGHWSAGPINTAGPLVLFGGNTPLEVLGNGVLNPRFTKHTLTIGDIIDEWNDSLASVTTERCAIEAASNPTLSDRIQTYRTKLNAVLGGVQSRFSLTASYFESMLVSKDVSPAAVIQTVNSDMNLPSIISAAENNEDVENSIINNDISNYTGASPFSALATGSVLAKGNEMVAKAVCATVAAAGNLIGQGLKWAFGKVGSFFNGVFNDPQDIENIGDDGDGWCIKDFQYQSRPQTALNPPLVTTTIPFKDRGATSEDMAIECANYILDHMRDMIGRWLAVETKGGSLRFRIVECDFQRTPLGSIDIEEVSFACQLLTKYEMVFKPKSLIFEPFVGKNGVLSDGYPRWNSFLNNVEYSDFFDKVHTIANGIYGDTNLSEADLVNCFRFGAMQSVLYSQALFYTLSQGHIGPTDSTFRLTVPDFSAVLPWCYGSMGNDNYMTTACGYEQSTNGFRFLPVASALTDEQSDYNGIPWVRFSTTRDNTTMASTGDILTEMAYCWISSFAYKFMVEFGADYTNPVYIPYTVGSSALPKGRFRIKTDTENQDVATALSVAIIAVVIIAVVVITGAVIASKIMKKTFKKRLAENARLDQKMWNGEELSDKELRRYRKNKRKMDASGYLSSASPTNTVTESQYTTPSSQDVTMQQTKQLRGSSNTPATLAYLSSNLTGI